jgi:formate-dependent phosphoribosylglycinamide formyltransferase (GAR transformylase)
MTGMVTLAGTQNFNEFELHLRAILLGLPIWNTLEKQERAMCGFWKLNESKLFGNRNRLS